MPGKEASWGKSGRKIKNHEIILCILVLAVIAAGLLLPETGNLVLLDEFCDVAVIWIVCIYVIVRVLRNRTALPFSGRAGGRGCGRYCMYRCCTLVFERHRARSCGRSADGHIDRHTAE